MLIIRIFFFIYSLAWWCVYPVKNLNVTQDPDPKVGDTAWRGGRESLKWWGAVGGGMLAICSLQRRYILQWGGWGEMSDFFFFFFCKGGVRPRPFGKFSPRIFCLPSFPDTQLNWPPSFVLCCPCPYHWPLKSKPFPLLDYSNSYHNWLPPVTLSNVIQAIVSSQMNF